METDPRVGTLFTMLKVMGVVLLLAGVSFCRIRSRAAGRAASAAVTEMQTAPCCGRAAAKPPVAKPKGQRGGLRDERSAGKGGKMAQAVPAAGRPRKGTRNSAKSGRVRSKPSLESESDSE